MLDGVVVQDGKDGGNADAVIGAQRGAVGRQPFAVKHRLDGILEEVELLVAVLLAHHIHMGLQADALRMLIAFRCRLADQHVAQLVAEGFKAVVAAEFLQIGRNFLFVFRRTRDLHNLAKITPYRGGFQL